MTQSPPPPTKPASKYCQREKDDGSRTCQFNYPQQIQATTTIDSHSRVHYQRPQMSDTFVVPHCLPLLRKFQCHINVEVTNMPHIFQYLHKYIYKGSSYFLVS